MMSRREGVVGLVVSTIIGRARLPYKVGYRPTDVITQYSHIASLYWTFYCNYGCSLWVLARGEDLSVSGRRST